MFRFLEKATDFKGNSRFFPKILIFNCFIFWNYSLSHNVDKLSRNSDKLSRNVDNLPYPKPFCPKILIKCPIMLINCPEILIKPYRFSSSDWLFQRPFVQKIGSTPLTRPPLSKGGSSMVKRVETTTNRHFS